MSPVRLIHHAARRGGPQPPSSLSGLCACIAARARLVEVDVLPLADGDFALLHDADLAESTDGQGYVAERTSDQARALHLRWRGAVTAEPVALLSEVVATVAGSPWPEELQLDLKAHVPLSDRMLASLAQRVSPLSRRVRVSSVADWALRRLHALAPWLALGFDPLLYLDVDPEGERDRDVPPWRVAAYGYRDDHPLASRRWGTPRAYLDARAEALLAQVPLAGVWYVRAALLAQALDDGFDLIAALHARGVEVAAWTLDPEEPGHLALAHRLLEAGVDRITTNDAPGLARALGTAVCF